jgi:hypothetical protein
MNNNRPIPPGCVGVLAYVSWLGLVAFAQTNPPDGDVPHPGKKLTLAEANATIQAVETLATDFEKGTKTYRAHLETALNTYGRGFFTGDIQSGDPEQSRRMKLAAFGSMIATAGIHYDPEFEWKQIDGLARDFMAAANNVELAGLRFADVLSPAIDHVATTVISTSLQPAPNIIVARKSVGGNDDGAGLIFEDVFRTVPAAVKGMGRIKRTSQFVQVSPWNGIHCGVREMAPVYRSGVPGYRVSTAT